MVPNPRLESQVFEDPEESVESGHRERSGIDGGLLRCKSASHFFESVEPKRMFIHARDEGEFFAAGFGEGFASANTDFLEGFQAISNKGGADDEELFDAFLGEFGEFVIGVGLKPGVAAQAGLERDGIFFFGKASFLHESRDGFKALSAIAGGVGRTWRFAAVLGGQAMAAGRIGFAKLALGQAVETEQQMVEAFVQVILRAGDECVDVVRVIEVRRLNLDAHSRRDLGCDFFDAFDGGFEAGHRIMREQWNEQKVVDAFLGQVLDGLGNRRALIAHGELDGDIEALLQFGLDVAARDDER